LSLTTYNVTSLCQYDKSKEGVLRRSRLYRTLSRLVKFDIICLQETKLKIFENRAISALSKTHKIFFNNNPNNVTGESHTAGTLIAVKHNVFYNYHMPVQKHEHNHIIIVPGHSHSIILEPLKGGWPVIAVTNARLSTGANKSEKQKTEIAEIRSKMGKGNLNYLAGDWNFTSEPDDSTRGTSDEPEGWSNLIRDLSFKEIKQPEHTYVFASSTVNHSSRIDRIYVSFPESEYLLADPKAWVVEEVFEDLRDLKSNLNSPGDSYSTHVPVVLSFFKKQNVKKPNTLHKNVFEDQCFLANFEKAYSKLGLYDQQDPEGSLKRYKLAVISAYHATKTKEHKPRLLSYLTACIRALRELDKPLPNHAAIVRLIEQNPCLAKLLKWDGVEWRHDSLRDAIAYLLKNGTPDPHSATEPEGDDEAISLKNNCANQATMVLKNLALVLPSTKKRVTALRTDAKDEPTNVNSDMGVIIEKFWGQVWRGPNEEELVSRSLVIDKYLDEYAVDDIELLPNLTIEHVKTSILTSGNSAVGPDGIPFIAYRRTVDTSAKILFNYANRLQGKPSNLSDFNRSTLLLIPKTESTLIKDTRPLCINNTDNRIIARALVILITPIVDTLIDKAQQGFIKGRRMANHLYALNKVFYDNWSANDEYYVLFTDNAKAFDSIQHDFLFKTLIAQNFPTWFVQTVKNLLSDVFTSPVLDPNTSVPITRGVKQGCPLSPILFVLIYDPLIRSLKENPDLTPLAAADDLAIGANNLQNLLNDAIPKIDDFCLASGMGINRNKTELLSTRDIDAPEPHASIVRSGPPYQAPTLLLDRQTAQPVPELSLPQLLEALGFSETPLTEHTGPMARESVPQHESQRGKEKGRREKEFEVNRITDKRWNPGAHPGNKRDQRNTHFGYWEYKVRYEDPYSLPSYDTWEPAENLTCCSRKVKEFNSTWTEPPHLKEILLQELAHCDANWSGIQLVNTAKYLGIHFSNSKDTYSIMEANYRPVLNAAKKRLNSYKHVLKNMSLSIRILIVNVFITSLFSYKIDFMLVPYPIYWEYRNLVTQAIVPYHGKAFLYEHLTIPFQLMGMKLHLVDLWVCSMYRQILKTCFRTLPNLADSLPWPLNTKDESQGIHYYSPFFSDNPNLAVMEFLGSNFLNWDGLTSLSTLKDHEIKKTLILHGLHRVKEDNTVQTTRYENLVTRFMKHGTNPENTLKHFAKLPATINNNLLVHHLRLYTNSLATDRRIKRFAHNASVHPRKSTINPFPCYLCENGEDSVDHIYTNCITVRNQLQLLAEDYKGWKPLISVSFAETLANSKLPLYVMDFDSPEDYNGAAFVLAFNYAIWELRKSVRAGGKPGIFNSLEVRHTLSRYCSLWMDRKPRRPSTSKYGSASNRSEKQRKRCLKDSLTMIESMGNNTIIFTDGASRGNPGPSGAGVCIILRRPNHESENHYLHCPLGRNTNNVGELWAVGMAVSYLLQLPRQTLKACRIVYILIDSQLVVNLLGRYAWSHYLEELVCAVLSLFREAMTHGCQIKTRWVPGHVDLEGNTIADRLATHGSHTSRTTTLKIPIPNEHFEYHIIDEPDILAHLSVPAE
jgi:ribonuclease HI/exonuclease III